MPAPAQKETPAARRNPSNNLTPLDTAMPRGMTQTHLSRPDAEPGNTRLFTPRDPQMQYRPSRRDAWLAHPTNNLYPQRPISSFPFSFPAKEKGSPKKAPGRCPKAEKCLYGPGEKNSPGTSRSSRSSGYTVPGSSPATPRLKHLFPTHAPLRHFSHRFHMCFLYWGIG